MRNLIVPALAAFTALAACQQQAPAPDTAAPDETPAAPTQPADLVTPKEELQPVPIDVALTSKEPVETLAHGNNLFAWSLYDQLDAEPGNLFISPASVSGAFALLYPGADGATAESMGALFGFGAVEGDIFAAAQRTLDQEVVADTERAKLTIANAVWLRESSALQEAYRHTVQDQMKAKVELVNFADPVAAAGLINSWVEDHTNKKIKDLIPPNAIHPQATELILTNAVWFKADWASPFQKEATQDGTFYAPDGEMTAKLMRQTLKHARYLSRDGYAALDLDYAGDEYALTVILPDAQDGLGDVAGAMTPEGFTSLLADMDAAAEKRVHLVLPKVKIEADYELNQPLIALGLGDAFTSNADFSKLIEGAGPGEIMISKVLHKTFLEIDEKGTEAAAATAIMMERAMIMQPEEDPVEFRADHPFLLALRHKPTGMVMFMGRVEAPPAAEE